LVRGESPPGYHDIINEMPSINEMPPEFLIKDIIVVLGPCLLTARPYEGFGPVSEPLPDATVSQYGLKRGSITPAWWVLETDFHENTWGRNLGRPGNGRPYGVVFMVSGR
jgi:hypothetical protein